MFTLIIQHINFMNFYPGFCNIIVKVQFQFIKWFHKGFQHRSFIKLIHQLTKKLDSYHSPMFSSL